jgi:hypothetical protein
MIHRVGIYSVVTPVFTPSDWHPAQADKAQIPLKGGVVNHASARADTASPRPALQSILGFLASTVLVALAALPTVEATKKN